MTDSERRSCQTFISWSLSVHLLQVLAKKDIALNIECRKTRPRWWFAVGIVALQACGGPPPNLPEIPRLATDAFTPQVRQQISEAREAVARDPHDAVANGRLAMTLHAYRLYPAAEVGYRRARAVDGKAFRWAYYHADVLKSMGRDDAAIAALRDSIRLDPDYPAAQARLGGLLISAGRYKQAEALLNEVLDQHPGHAEALYELGRLRLRAGQLEDGVMVMQDSLAASGPNAGAYFAIADAHRQLGRPDLAARFYRLHDEHKYRQPRKHDPLLGEIARFDQSANAMVNRAKSAYAAGNLPAAIRNLNEALARDPDNFLAHTALVGVYARTGQLIEADQHYDKALALAPATAQLHLNRAAGRMAAKRWAEAAESLERALVIDPYNAATHAQLGFVRDRQGQSDAAMSQFRLALQHDPGLLAAREALANALIATGQNHEAVTLLADIVQAKDPASARALTVLATAHENLGDLEAAIAALEQARSAMADKPRDPLARRIQARLRELSARVSAQTGTD